MSEREKIELVWDSIAPSLKRELKLHTPGKNYNELIVPLSHMCRLSEKVLGTRPFRGFCNANSWIIKQ